MRRRGVVVELTFHAEGAAMGHIEEVFEATKDQPNVVFDPVNELYSIHDCHKAWWWTNYIYNHGGHLTTAGAWGHGGKEWSDRYFEGDSLGNLTNRIIGVHRTWDSESITKYLDKQYQDAPITHLQKPIVRSEFFGMSPDEMQARMRADFAAGAAGVNYFGDWFEAAGEVLREQMET